MTELELTSEAGLSERYVSGTYPESPAHILDGGSMNALCGSRISAYKRPSTQPQRRLCAKCAKKAGLQSDMLAG
jgi:hypothetical protein